MMILVIVFYNRTPLFLMFSSTTIIIKFLEKPLFKNHSLGFCLLCKMFQTVKGSVLSFIGFLVTIKWREGSELHNIQFSPIILLRTKLSTSSRRL